MEPKNKLMPKNNSLKSTPEIIARRRFVKVTPDKVRRTGALIRGKKYQDALAYLRFYRPAGGSELIKTLQSAAAIGREREMPDEELAIKSVIVSEGPRLKRRRIIRQGRSTTILKRGSHLTVIMAPKSTKHNQIGSENGS